MKIKLLRGGMIGLLLAIAMAAANTQAGEMTGEQLIAKARELRTGRSPDYGEAIRLYREALALVEDDDLRTQARWGLGMALVPSGAFEEGSAILEELLSEDMLKSQDRPETRRVMGDGRMSARDYARAVEAYEAMANEENIAPGHLARALTRLGEAEYARADYDAARAAWERAVAVERTAPVHRRRAWPGLGDSFMAEGRWEEARAAYERVLEAENACGFAKLSARIGAGNAAYAAGDYPAAARVYLEVLALGHDEFRGWDGRRLELSERLDTIFRVQLQKADELLAAGKYAKARAEYEKVFGMTQAEDHHKGTAQLGVGNALAAGKEHAEARRAYEKVLKMPGAHWPDRGRAQIGIARSFDAEGKRAEAREAYKAVLKMKNVSRFDRAAAASALD